MDRRRNESANQETFQVISSRLQQT